MKAVYNNYCGVFYEDVIDRVAGSLHFWSQNFNNALCFLCIFAFCFLCLLDDTNDNLALWLATLFARVQTFNLLQYCSQQVKQCCAAHSAHRLNNIEQYL